MFRVILLEAWNTSTYTMNMSNRFGVLNIGRWQEYLEKWHLVIKLSFLSIKMEQLSVDMGNNRKIHG